MFNLAATGNVPSIGSSMSLLTTLGVSFCSNVSHLVNQMLSCYQKEKKKKEALFQLSEVCLWKINEENSSTVQRWPESEWLVDSGVNI